MRQTLGLFALVAFVSPGSQAVWAKPDAPAAEAPGLGTSGTAAPGSGRPLSQGFRLTEAEIAAIAVERNPRLRALRARLGRSRAELVAAGLLPNPEVETRWLAATDERAVGGEVNVLVDLRDVLLLRGPRMDAARFGLEEAKLRLTHEEWQVAMDTRAALLAVSALESERVLEENRSRTYERMLEILQARHEVGDASKLEVLSLELEVLDLTRNRIALEGDGKRAISRLGAVMGLGPGEAPPEVMGLMPGLSRPDQDRSSRGLDVLVSRLAQTRADVLAAAAAVEAAEHVLIGARRGQMPAFRLGPSYERDGGEDAIGGVLELEIPLFDRNQAEVRAALSATGEAKEAFRATLLEAERELADAWARREAAERELTVIAREAEPRILEMIETTLQAFELGDLPTVEALLLQTRAIDAQRTFLQRLRDARSAQLDLDRATGPYAELDLQGDR